jgi:hypothetical protein
VVLRFRAAQLLSVWALIPGEQAIQPGHQHDLQQQTSKVQEHDTGMQRLGGDGGNRASNTDQLEVDKTCTVAAICTGKFAYTLH